jgi:hypothetical protein
MREIQKQFRPYIQPVSSQNNTKQRRARCRFAGHPATFSTKSAMHSGA